MTECDHTPDGTLIGHIEIWAVDDGFTAVAFIRGRQNPEVVVHCEESNVPLEVAADALSMSIDEIAA